MPLDIRVRRSMKSKLDKDYNPRQNWMTGFTGDANGVVKVPGMPGFIWVRDWRGFPHKCFNDSVPVTAPGYQVRFGYDPYTPGLLRVLGAVSQYVDESTPPTPKIGPHHTTHEWPNTDTVWVHGQQFLPALIHEVSGMTVTISPFWMRTTAGTFIYITERTLDLTPYIPVSGACYALISFAQDGTLDVNTDTTAASMYALRHTPVSSHPDASYRSIGAVMLRTGQTSITRSEEGDPIVDMRWFSEQGGDMFKADYDADDDGVVDDSESTQALRGTAVDPALAPNDSDILTWVDANLQWEALPYLGPTEIHGDMIYRHIQAAIEYAALGTATVIDTWAGSASLIIDGNDTTNWESTTRCNSNPWFKIDLGAVHGIIKFRFKQYGNAGATWSADTYKVEGSNDNSSWTVLATRTGIAEETVVFGSLQSYRYFKVTCTSGSGSWGWKVFTFELWDLEADIDRLERVPAPTADGQILGNSGATPQWVAESIGITDHGDLTGLADDDHTQYILGDRADWALLTGGSEITLHSHSTPAHELLMQDGVTSPPVPLENEAGDDWLYEG